jgi:eukaryotic-like serine/threonine-protein kinase
MQSSPSSLVPADSVPSGRISAPVPSSKSRPSYAPGDVVAGKYQLRRKVAETGGRVTWLARASGSGTFLAVDILRADGDHRPELDPLRIARAVSDLHHAAVARVIDCGATRGRDYFLVRDLPCGETLGETLERVGRLPALRAVQTLLPALDGLAAADGMGVIHGDLRPQSILLGRTTDGRIQPVVFGFGVARILDGARIPLARLAYMAPEAARRLDVDGRADVWSMCACLYETIAGVRPFPEEDPSSLLKAITVSPPRDLAAVGLVDGALGSILRRGLSKRRDERWWSIRALRVALATWLASHGVEDDIGPRAEWLETTLPVMAKRASGTIAPPTLRAQ